MFAEHHYASGQTNSVNTLGLFVDAGAAIGSLLKLGFIGDEYKVARKILLANLEGNSAWRESKKRLALAGRLQELFLHMVNELSL